MRTRKIEAAGKVAKILEFSKTGLHTIEEYMKYVGTQRNYTYVLLNKLGIEYQAKKSEDTICWKCKNTKCDWSRKFKPVENWQAEKVRVKIQNNTEVDSYIVRSCPEFTTQQKAIKSSYGHKDLSEAIVIKALRDYKYLTDNQLDEAFICKDNSKISKNEIKTFLKSEIGQLTLHIMNLENSVNRLLGE